MGFCSKQAMKYTSLCSRRYFCPHNCTFSPLQSVVPSLRENLCLFTQHSRLLHPHVCPSILPPRLPPKCTCSPPCNVSRNLQEPRRFYEGQPHRATVTTSYYYPEEVIQFLSQVVNEEGTTLKFSKSFAVTCDTWANLCREICEIYLWFVNDEDAAI